MGFKKLYSDEFIKILQNVKNTYGDGGATQKIIKILKNLILRIYLKKYSLILIRKYNEFF